jgi:hypothetical protein
MALDHKPIPTQLYQTTKCRHYHTDYIENELKLECKKPYATPWPVVCSITSGAIQHGVPTNVLVRSLRSPTIDIDHTTTTTSLTLILTTTHHLPSAMQPLPNRQVSRLPCRKSKCFLQFCVVVKMLLFL